MGCSSSTQTQNQGTNKPPAKSVETNGPKKSASSGTSDQIVDDIETIPDQTKLVPLTEHEASTNGVPPEEEQIEAMEVDASEPAAEPCEASGDPEIKDADQSSSIQEIHDHATAEGEIEVVETKMHEEAAHDAGETKEEETGHSVDAAEPEISASTLEE